MRGLNLKEIMSKSNMDQQGLNIATYGQAYQCLPSQVFLVTHPTFPQGTYQQSCTSHPYDDRIP